MLMLASAAQRAFFHVAVAHAGVEDDLLQPRQVFPGLVGRSDVGLADDFDQRHAGAVQVDRGPFAAVGQAVVQALARVFFQVHARDADLLRAVRGFDLDVAVLGQRLVVLRNLIALGQVGIEVVLAREDGGFANLAVQRGRGEDGELHRALVQHRQSTRHSQAHRTDIGVGRIAEVRRAAAKDLSLRQQLDVDFQSDDRFVLGTRRNGSFWRGCHNARL